MAATITIISLPVVDPDSFERLSIEERRTHGPTGTFPISGGTPPDTFLMKATKTDLGVFENGASSDSSGALSTCMIDGGTLASDIADLEDLVEAHPAQTARALYEHGQKTGDLSKIEAALRTGAWPATREPAEEAAAFAFQLLRAARYGKDHTMGVCWELRG